MMAGMRRSAQTSSSNIEERRREVLPAFLFSRAGTGQGGFPGVMCTCYRLRMGGIGVMRWSVSGRLMV